MVATLKAKERPDLRRSTTKSLRNNGNIPAVVYGKDQEPLTIAINSSELLKTIQENGRHAVYELAIEGVKPMNVMLYDVQTEPLREKILHADFYKVDMSSEVEVEVAIKLVGQENIKDGIVQQTLHQLEVRAKPNEIPEFLQIDISDLKIGDSLNIGDLIKDGHTFQMLGDKNTVIVTILPPQSAGNTESMAGQAEAEKEADVEEAKKENEKEK
jgi:large subunit ribosomal protein L25